MERSITLYCREGGSDKVYQLQQRPVPGSDLWMVYYANGPRGGVMRFKPKTPEPVPLAVAQQEYDKVVKSKMKDGYHEGEDGQAYATSEFEGRANTHRQQLPTAISHREASDLLADPSWVLQEKANGERRALQVLPTGEVRGINKLGLYTPVPANWVAAFADLAREGGALIDAEQVGEQLLAFDVVEIGGRCIRHLPLGHRLDHLAALVARHGGTGPHCVLRGLDVARTQEEKKAAAARIEAANGEGYVLKFLDAPYDAGRSIAAYKFKFVESATVVVMAKNTQRSVRIGLLDAGGDLVELCNVTVPANRPIPEPGALVEVQYLYYNPGGGFEQPVYLNERRDVRRDECNFGQVRRLKPGASMPAHLWNDPAAGEQDAEVAYAAPRG